MKRISLDAIEAQIQAAPILVIPWASGRRAKRPYEVPASEADKVKSGIITMSPLGLFFLQVKLWWEFLYLCPRRA